jgi:prevent-host-death family protein
MARIWTTSDARTRFSEVVRKARSEGPQQITLRGEASAVVMALEQYNRLKAEYEARERGESEKLSR